MDAFLERAVEEYGLTTIGVNFFAGPLFAQTNTPFTVYVHWEGGCKSGNGKTVREALACALEQMREERRA
jgi:ribosomal protein S9